MNRFASLAIFVWSLLCLTACEDKSFVLGFNTQNPTPTSYELNSSMQVLLNVAEGSADSVQSMSAEVSIHLHSELLSAYDDGTGRFLLSIDSANYTSNVRSVEESDHIGRYLKTQAVQYKMGSDGKMSSVQFDEMVALPDIGDVDVRKLFLKIQLILPSAPLAVGDSWERQQAISDENGRLNTVYKWFLLEEVFERDGSRLARIKMNIRYRQSSEDDMQVTESPDFILGSGTILFNIDVGKIVEGSLDVEGKLRVIEKQFGDTIPDLRIRQKISLRSTDK